MEQALSDARIDGQGNPPAPDPGSPFLHQPPLFRIARLRDRYRAIVCSRCLVDLPDRELLVAEAPDATACDLCTVQDLLAGLGGGRS